MTREEIRKDFNLTGIIKTDDYNFYIDYLEKRIMEEFELSTGIEYMNE